MFEAEAPTVSILLLGDPACGKTTFLSKITHGKNRIADPTTPASLDLIRDYDQPIIFELSLYNRHYRLEFSDTASPDNYTLMKPDFVILCYDISNRQSLTNVSEIWSKQLGLLYMTTNPSIPVLLLGLKRDLRKEGDGIIHPQEAHRLAQEMSCDMYAECSALTGELMLEVFEDIARRAARTTTPKGALSDFQCSVS